MLPPLLALLASLSVPSAASIALFPAGDEAVLRARGAAIWGRDGEVVVAGADEGALDGLAATGVVPLARVRDEGQWVYLLEHDAGWSPPAAPGAFVQALSPTSALYLFAPGHPVLLPAVRPFGAFLAVPRRALEPLAPHPADAAAAAAAAGPRAAATINPLVTEIVARTSQSEWFQDVKDLSGENAVVIGGNSYTIRTRYSDAMFPAPAANAYATEYLLDRGASWGFPGVREDYTPGDSGCGNQAKTWQNVVFTIPGQVDFAGHEQVLFVNHYDSISDDSFNYSPGADDAISGGCALLEALRTFRGYAFRRTLKVIFFSGEEVGICGSGAYVRQHPARDMWRVVNMDQTAFDGNLDRIMNVYNWNAMNSPASVALGDAFVQANQDYGPIVAPANVVRDTSRMCRTDHCPFWSVGVAAIALLEDLHDGDVCPCFDQGQSPTCHDSVTQVWNGRPMFDPDYSWPTEKAAVATVAMLADPLYRCPQAAPAVTATPRNGAVHLSWPAVAGVTDYVVERATACDGTFTAIATLPGTTFDDAPVANGSTFAYRIRTCPGQTGACAVVAPAPGPSVAYRDGSAAVESDSGDADGVLDNCETAVLRLDLVNDGTIALTGVRLATVLPSDPGVKVVSGVPQVAAGALAPGASVTLRIRVRVDGVACGAPVAFAVTARSDQSAPRQSTFALPVERDPRPAPLDWGFETDFSGWQVVSGTFTRVAGGAPGSTGGSLHSGNANNECHAVQSPLLVPGAASQMTLFVDYGIEAGNNDRAVVRAIDDATGDKTLLVPNGRPYTTAAGGDFLCDGLGILRGWSGNSGGWQQATFDLAPLAGRAIRIEARYSTDGANTGATGFWLDLVHVTDATQLDCDAQPNACPALPAEVSPSGATVPFTIVKRGTGYELRFAEVAGATAYHVYPGTLRSLRAAGLYDHTAAPGLCGFVDPTPGDGEVRVARASLPDDAYFFAVARNSAGEGIYATDSAGNLTPEAATACP